MSNNALTALAEKSRQADLPASLRGVGLRLARGAWWVLLLIALAVLIGSAPGYVQGFNGKLAHVADDQATAGRLLFAAMSALASLSSAILSFVLSAILYRRRFTNPVAASLAFYLLFYSVVMAGPLERLSYLRAGTTDLAIALQGMLMTTPTLALFALFPNGRFVPAWMRWVLLGSLPSSILLLYLTPAATGNLPGQRGLAVLLGILFLIFVLAGLFAQVYRYRHVSSSAERQQTKWVVFGFALWLLFILASTGPYLYLANLPPGTSAPWWAALSETLWGLSLSIVPISLTIAITRYKLWNIDWVINRTLVYGALTVSVIGLYLLAVAGLGWLFRSSDSVLIPILATALAAVAFQPLRQRLQSAVNRLMYGERDDPVIVLRKLGERLEGTGTPQATLAGIVETVAQALKLPFVAIEWGEEGEAIASFGVPSAQAERLPMAYQGEPMGHLVIGHRSRKESFSPNDRQLLENIARQAAAIVYSAQLTADLLRARERLVTSREEERRRIRRDLHDELGPDLAGLALKLDAARNTLGRDPHQADQLLAELKAQAQASVHKVRRLAYNLRPPALDEMGLAEALRERAEALSSAGRLHIRVSCPDHLPPLSAAIEVAAYRIAQEAMTNAMRHSGGTRCDVRLRIGRGLELEVIDDGSGVDPQGRQGVGLLSMRERAAELGGTFEIGAAPGGGARLFVRFPLPGKP